jgi:hypothetical protein
MKGNRHRQGKRRKEKGEKRKQFGKKEASVFLLSLFPTSFCPDVPSCP